MALVGLLFGENVENYFQAAEELRLVRDARMAAAAQAMNKRQAEMVPVADMSPDAPDFEARVDRHIAAVNRLGHDPQLRRDEAELWAAKEEYTAMRTALLNQALPADGNFVVRTARLLAQCIG